MHFDRLITEDTVKVLNRKQNPVISERKTDLGCLTQYKLSINENAESRDAGKPPPTPSRTNLVKLNGMQSELFSLLSGYQDLLYTNETNENLDDIQQAYACHILEHLTRAKETIITNNKVVKNPDRADDLTIRDQGYARPKVLVLLPFRHSALRLSKCLANLLKGTHETVHINRVIEEFGDEDGTDSTLKPIVCDGNKPSDYYNTFHGNTDDSFRIGIRLTKRSIKFFADFYDSDIIIASPLGLKTLIAPNENDSIGLANKNKSDQLLNPVGDRDFLSSIEMLILDQTEIFLMQNWEHLIDIMQHVNEIPSKPRSMDIARVRMWHLENWSKYYRQLILFSSATLPIIQAFFQSHSHNYEGHMVLKRRMEHPQARKISSKCTQHFLYYDSPNPKESCDLRFNFFIKNVLPKCLGRQPQAGAISGDGTTGKALEHTLIFVSSYFDYVRLRNYFRREKLSFTQICEYTEDNKVSKARQLFYFGARQFLIYTERCHFYHRFKIKGIRNIIFYEPPMFARHYSEMIDFMTPELQGKTFDEDSSSPFTATTLFSNHDKLQMGSIIGLNNADKLIQNKKSIN